MPQTLRLARFQFTDVDIRRVGQTVDGGTSLSGVSDVIEADGGGYWQADFTNGYTRTAADGLAWRQVSDLGTTTPVDVVLDAERWFGPGLIGHVPEQPSPLTDGSEFPTPAFYVGYGMPLRATQIVIAKNSAVPALRPGILFSIPHIHWGWRAYRIQTVASDGATVTIRPPLRELTPDTTVLEFDYPRCRMRLAQQPGNPTTLGKSGTCSASFVEDMRQPT